jgi:hypothetical protein
VSFSSFLILLFTCGTILEIHAKVLLIYTKYTIFLSCETDNPKKAEEGFPIGATPH